MRRQENKQINENWFQKIDREVFLIGIIIFSGRRNKYSIPNSIRNQSFQLKLKEAAHIRWTNPSLNRQLKHAELTLSF